MKLKQLFTDDSAVSPVIGVILMVAITVILAAVIGTFVLNLGGSVSQTSPQASFGFNFNADGGGSGEAQVVITHETGDSIQKSQTSIVVSGSGSYSENSAFPSATISAGDSTTWQKGSASDTSWAGESIRVVWESETGDTSATLSETTAPGA